MFVYCGNNPVSRTDPSGHSWIEGLIEGLKEGIKELAERIWAKSIDLKYELKDQHRRKEQAKKEAMEYADVLQNDGWILTRMELKYHERTAVQKHLESLSVALGTGIVGLFCAGPAGLAVGLGGWTVGEFALEDPCTKLRIYMVFERETAYEEFDWRTKSPRTVYNTESKLVIFQVDEDNQLDMLWGWPF